MSDTIANPRVEPIMDPGPVPLPERRDLGHAPPPPPEPPRPPVLAARDPEPAPVSQASSSVGDQLARLEDKTSRIEEKLARAEASTQRVVDRFEASSHRMSEVAQQSDLVATRNDVKYIARRVKALPGFAALILASVVTAVLTAILTIAIVRYMPGLLAR